MISYHIDNYFILHSAKNASVGQIDGKSVLRTFVKIIRQPYSYRIMVVMLEIKKTGPCMVFDSYLSNSWKAIFSNVLTWSNPCQKIYLLM